MQWYVTLCVNIIKVISSLMCGVCVCVVCMRSSYGISLSLRHAYLKAMYQ